MHVFDMYSQARFYIAPYPQTMLTLSFAYPPPIPSLSLPYQKPVKAYLEPI